jgi:hypothetical protein
MPRSSDIWYVYGVVPAAMELAHAPDGLEDAPLESCVEGEVAAVVSRLDDEQYAPAAVERGTADVEWLAPRAVAHDRVLTWVSDHGPVVPLPIFSLFSSEQAVRQMLRDRGTQLRGALRRAAAGREYALRVYRIDDELADAAVQLSQKLAELHEAAMAASPGQRYLIERKLDAERKNEVHLIAARVAREVIEALRPLAVETAESRIVTRAQRGSPNASLILDAAFLVDASGLEPFQRELTAIVARHASRGFRFDFTGPWPPYHFVQNQPESAADDA